jgi:hypothetical protein
MTHGNILTREWIMSNLINVFRHEKNIDSVMVVNYNELLSEYIGYLEKESLRLEMLNHRPIINQD